MKCLSWYKIVNKDVNILEYEIYRIQQTNHLMPFDIYETIDGRWMIIINALWKNSLNYGYFRDNYMEVTGRHINLLKERLVI